MGYRKGPLISGNYYHIFNRGNNHQDIFIEKKNYYYFFKKIVNAFDDKIELICYCFMPNHYHLIVHSNEDNSISIAMQKIATGYSRAINKAYQRNGHLFEGSYKNKLIPNNDYLLHLSRYIHLNPLKAKLIKKIEEWIFSSYLDYTGKRRNAFLKMNTILEQFGKEINQVSQRNLVYKKYEEFVNSFQADSFRLPNDLLID
ncbi:MAG: transposase [Ignavibacteria bacterium]